MSWKIYHSQSIINSELLSIFAVDNNVDTAQYLKILEVLLLTVFFFYICYYDTA